MAWELRNGAYWRPLMAGDDYQNVVEEVVFAQGEADLLTGQWCACGYYVVSGELVVGEQCVGQDTLLWITAGCSLPARITKSVHAVFIGTKRALGEGDASYQVFIEPELAWSRPLEDGMTASRHMVRAEDWGVKIQTCIYTCGFRHAWHSHAHAHGIYVLEGVLRNDFTRGQDSFYGPGEFALTPAHAEVLHEPAPGDGCVRYLFVGDGPFDFIVDGVDLYGKH